MTRTDRQGSGSSGRLSFGDFSAESVEIASPARVDGWPPERDALAVRPAPFGPRQGGAWGSKT